MIATERLFWQDPYLLEFDARVLERREHLGRPAVVLDRTAFYAESGGQPWDTGTLDGVRVSSVIEQGGEILHVLDAPLVAEAVHGHVDADRRRDHRQQHHGQHLLSRALTVVASAETVSFHLGAEACSVDVDREVSPEQAAAAEQLANEVVWSARPVSVQHMSRAEAESKGLDPSEHVGDTVRVVVVPDFDMNPCGGTHPGSTADVGLVLVLGVERYKAGTRVHFVCGHRALRTARRHIRLIAEACAAASAPLDKLPETVAELVQRVAAADKRSRELLDWALEGEARTLLAPAVPSTPSAGPASTGTPGAPPVIVRGYDGWPAQDLRTLAIKLTRAGSCIALLGSRADGKAHLVFAQSEGLGIDLGALLKDALAVVTGRGGGRGNLVQGGGERADRLDEALSSAGAAVGQARG